MAKINGSLNLFDKDEIYDYSRYYTLPRRIKLTGFAFLSLVAIAFFNIPELKADCFFIPTNVAGTCVVTAGFNRNIAQEFPQKTQWVNTSKALKLDDLRGKIVILNFWTDSSINCQHVLPDLNYLAKKYTNDLVIIGVHLGKFASEKDSKNIQQAA